MLRILLVEDNIEILENTSEILTLSGFTVFTASSAKQGLRIAHDQQLDVIITDVVMPDVDGWQMAQDLRGDQRTAHIPIIFLTAHAEEIYRERARALGVADYVVKPFTSRQLIQTLQSYM